MDRCTGRCDITEILLKTALNTIKPNMPTVLLNVYQMTYMCILGPSKLKKLADNNFDFDANGRKFPKE